MSRIERSWVDVNRLGAPVTKSMIEVVAASSLDRVIAEREALLVYRGDKVLRAWPLDCSDAPDTQVIGVPRDWLQEWALELVEAAQDGGQMSNQVEHLLEIHSKP